MPEIFISYRHDDTGPHVQNMCAYLIKRFGSDSIFWDKKSIPEGQDYEEVIAAAIDECIVVVAVFGNRWLYDRPDKTRGPSDEVLEELRAATRPDRKTKVKFVTVTISPAGMPPKDEVPAFVHNVTKVQAVEISSGARIYEDYDRIASIIDGHLKPYRLAKLATDSVAPDNLIGQVISNYRIVARLGEGGMGTVYRAEHPMIHRKAAVKVLKPEFVQNADVVERFINEARAANALRHPNIVDIMDVGRLPIGTPYLLMEFLEGTSLTGRIAQVRRLPLDEALDFASQAASALGALHVKGIIHRDLKPDNIYLVPDETCPRGERVKILDFGIAKFLLAAPGGSRTVAGTVMGTPLYMAPEQCGGRSEDVDQRTDIYALGVVLYEMLCGEPPFNGKRPEDILIAHLTSIAPSPRSKNPSIPVAVEAVILKALSKGMKDRFGSMPEMARALSASLAVSPLPFAPTVVVPVTPVTPPRVVPPPRKLDTTTLGGGTGEIAPMIVSISRRSWTVAAVVVLVAGLTATMAFRKDSGRPPEQVRVRIRSSPSDALVTNLANNTTFGYTPIDIKLDRASDVLAVSVQKDHFKSSTLQVPLGQDFEHTEPLVAIIEPPPPPPPPIPPPVKPHRKKVDLDTRSGDKLVPAPTPEPSTPPSPPPSPTYVPKYPVLNGLHGVNVE